MVFTSPIRRASHAAARCENAERSRPAAKSAAIVAAPAP
jgi:hypothetical protein